jgi:hypothetical protein
MPKPISKSKDTSIMSHSTAETLTLAATIAARLQAKGAPCSPQDALDRARAAQLQVAQLKALAAADWAGTAIEPPLPAELLVEAGFAA